MRGILDAAGGVDSASSNNKTKNATKIFIPETQKSYLKKAKFAIFTQHTVKVIP